MRLIAEFFAVLACGLFTGAAVYISLVEHPARMECGVEIAATEFPPRYRRASVMQATLAAVGLLSSIAASLAGATFWWLIAGVLLGSVIPFTLIVILADQQAVVEPCAGQAVSPNRSLTRPLGQVARPEKCAQWCGASAVLVFGDLQEAPLVGPLNENRSIAILGSIFSGVGISEKKFSSPDTLNCYAEF